MRFYSEGWWQDKASREGGGTIGAASPKSLRQEETMAKAGYDFEWLMIDTTDPEITEVYVLLKAWGDCPMGVQGWHHKSFPARIPSVDIIKDYIAEAVMWPQKAPPWDWRKDPTRSRP